MEHYEPFITISASDVWGPKTYSPGVLVYGPYNPPPLPVAAPRSYEPRTESQRVVPSPKPSPSWEAVKRSGEIRMTPYEAERITTFNYLAGREDIAVVFYRTMDGDASKYPAVCTGQETFELERLWREQGDFAYWSLKYDSISLNPYADIDLSPYVASTRTSAIASFKGGYDFLTEMAEARQGLQFFKESSAGVYSIFRKFFTDHGDAVSSAIRKNPKLTPRDLLRSADRNARKAGSAWLAYRYAIMPLYYSYESVRELLERVGITYQSYRESDRVTLESPSLAGLPNGLYEVSTGTITIASTIKAAYSNAFLRDYTFNQVQWNPFATAWELVPFSFVMDWFVNVGDYIVGSTSTDFSLKAAGCTSVKTEVTVEALLRYAEVRDIRRTHAKHNFPTAATSCQKADIVRTRPFETNTTESCRSTVIERYVRTPFDLDSASLAFNPSMNWKRAVDAVALSHQPLKNLLRRVRK